MLETRGGSFVSAAGLLSPISNTRMDTQSAAKKPLLKRWWVWAILALGVFMLIGSLGKPSQNGQAQNVQDIANPEPTYTVTALALASEYKANEVAADAKYKGQLIEISGRVDTIGKDIVDTPYIAFETENPYEVINRIQCMFRDADTASLSTVSKGQSITLRGTVSGALGNIIIKDCRIVE